MLKKMALPAASRMVISLALTGMAVAGCSAPAPSVNLPGLNHDSSTNNSAKIRVAADVPFDPAEGWSAAGQFVRFDSDDHGVAINDQHPAKVTRGQIHALLSTLMVRADSDEEPAPLFTPEELNTLAIQLPQALALAKPNQDVVFATIGLRETALVLRRPTVTTGRVFFQNGALNLIVGQVQGDTRNQDSLLMSEDPRLHPYVPGSRSAQAEQSMQILPPADPTISWKSASRPDWFVFGPAALAAAAPVATPATSAIEQQLQTVEELRRKGLITDDEAKAKRAQILSHL